MITESATAGLAPLVAAINSWPAAIVAIVVFIAPHVATYIQGRKTKVLAAQAAADAAQTREQTVNEHQNHPTPNLREQLDAQDDRLASIEAGVGKLVAAFEEHVTSDAEWKTSVEDDLHARRFLLPWRR